MQALSQSNVLSKLGPGILRSALKMLMSAQHPNHRLTCGVCHSPGVLLIGQQLVPGGNPYDCNRDCERRSVNINATCLSCNLSKSVVILRKLLPAANIA